MRSMSSFLPGSVHHQRRFSEAAKESECVFWWHGLGRAGEVSACRSEG